MLSPVNSYFNEATINQIVNPSPFQTLLGICSKSPLSDLDVNYGIYLLSIVNSQLTTSLNTDMKDLGMDSLINTFTKLATTVLSSRLDESVNTAQLFLSNINNFKTALTKILTAVSKGNTGPTLEEALFYEYARTGEATLNQEVGNLGDAISTLTSLANQLNRIESVLAIDPGSSYINERGELTITTAPTDGSTASNVPLTSNGSTSFFYNRVEFKNIEVSPTGGYNNAVQVLISSLQQLKGILTQLPSGSDQYNAVSSIVTQLDSMYNVSSWIKSGSVIESFWADRDGGDPNNGELYWKTQYGTGTAPKNFARLFMDAQFRKSIGDAISIAQSQNDIQKQQLAKSLFVYQEFIKSSSSLLDMTFKTSKSIASKLSR